MGNEKEFPEAFGEGYYVNKGQPVYLSKRKSEKLLIITSAEEFLPNYSIRTEGSVPFKVANSRGVLSKYYYTLDKLKKDVDNEGLVKLTQDYSLELQKKSPEEVYSFKEAIKVLSEFVTRDFKPNNPEQEVVSFFIDSLGNADKN